MAEVMGTQKHFHIINMKLLIAFCLFAVALAHPARLAAKAAAPAAPVPPVSIIKDIRVEPDDDGHYEFEIETTDGIHRSESGDPQAVHGAISFTLPNGELYELTFVADENGFHPSGSVVPVMPPHALEQIRLAELEDSDEDSD